MTDSVATEQKKSRRGLLALVGAGGAAAVAALLGRRDGAEAATYTWTSSASDATGQFNNNDSGDGVRGDAHSGVGVMGKSTVGVGVYGYSPTSFGMHGRSDGNNPGVYGWGKPGVWGGCNQINGPGVRGDGYAPGSIGVLAKNTPDRRALRTQGRVQMDTARKVTLSNRSNLVKLPTGVQAGAFAIVLAMVQGASGNGAFVRRAWRVDDKHIRITFDKKPANPTAVGYWVVQTG